MVNQNSNPSDKTKVSEHTIHMEQRNKLLISGVLDVSSFHEDEIVLKVDSGLVIISGEKLHVSKLVLEEGKVEVSGWIDGMNYEKPKVKPVVRGFWKQGR